MILGIESFLTDIVSFLSLKQLDHAPSQCYLKIMENLIPEIP